MKRIILAAMLLATPALAADPAPVPTLSAHDAQELSALLVSANVSYKGSDVAEIVRLLTTLNAIAVYTPPAPAAQPKK